MGNKLEALRKQAQDAQVITSKDPSKSAVEDAAKAFDAKASAVEAKLIDLQHRRVTQTERSRDGDRAVDATLAASIRRIVSSPLPNGRIRLLLHSV
jgi:hypothetical protein